MMLTHRSHWSVATATTLIWFLAPCLVANEPDSNKDEIILVAGEDAPKDHVRSSVFLAMDRLPAGSNCRFAVVLDVENGWHINSNPARPDFAVPTDVTVTAKHGTKAEKVEYPKGKDLTIEGLDEPFSVYEGRVVLFGTLKVPADAAQRTEELTVEIKFQACDDKRCLRPKTIKLTGKIPVAAKGDSIKSVNEKLFEPDRKKNGRNA